MRRVRFAAFVSMFLLAPAAAADDTAGLQVLIDLQDPAQIAKSFCVLDSKLYSQDAQVCVPGSTVRLTCAEVDAADASKGVKWTVAPDEKTARCK